MCPSLRSYYLSYAVQVYLPWIGTMHNGLCPPTFVILAIISENTHSYRQFYWMWFFKWYLFTVISSWLPPRLVIIHPSCMTKDIYKIFHIQDNHCLSFNFGSVSQLNLFCTSCSTYCLYLWINNRKMMHFFINILM